MSQIQSLILGAGPGPIRSRISSLAGLMALLELVNKLRTAASLPEILSGVSDLARAGAELTETTTDDEFVAKAEKYFNTPEAAALLEAALTYWKTLPIAA